MISNHPQFLEAIQEKKKVSVRFYSKADNGVLERICAPVSYGQGSESRDEFNRYWFWDYAGNSGSHELGLLPQQVLNLQVLGEAFDPNVFTTKPSPASVPPTGGLPAAAVIPPTVRQV